MDVTDSKTQSHAKTTQQNTATPALVGNIGSRTVPALCDLLEDMYEQIDDTLFDLADRAHNNSEQTLYFESMREIRLHRQASMQVYRQSLENGFKRLQSSEVDLVTVADLEAETLALVDNDEMETDVAINNMVHRARCEYPAQLLQLNTRLNTFLPNECATEDSNPVDPKQVVKAFTLSTQDVEIDIKVRLILFKEFERCVLKRLDNVLLDANQILINAGVLPDIRATLSRSSTNKLDDNGNPTNEENGQIEASEQESAEAAAVHFDTLQSLLSATENLQEESIYIQQDPQQPSLPQHALFDWLSDIQKQYSTPNNEQLEPVAVRQEVFEMIKQAGNKDPNNRLNKVDDNVINVVDMIFEFILDQDIPSPMAALIGRLQIPILKVAIRDRDFFDSHKHPARRLLNEIAHASLGWDANSNYNNDPLYKEVEHVVRRILKEEHPSVELFQELEEEFHTYIDKETQRTDRLAERTAAAEEGKAKAAAAKKMIEQVIHDRIHGKELPPVVIDFLNAPWQKYLPQINLKFGNQSEEWRDALKAADDLIWSVHFHTEPKAKQRWMKLIPVLLENIRAGLEHIAHSPTETEKTMSALWEIHSQMLAHKGDGNPVNTVKVDLTNKQQRAHISPLVRRKVPHDTIRELRQLVNRIEVGSWFEFKQIDGNTIRCRLIRKIRANDSFVFANRYGAKAQAITKDQLALYIHDEKAKLLDSGPLIDRALQAIMLKLKNSLP